MLTNTNTRKIKANWPAQKLHWGFQVALSHRQLFVTPYQPVLSQCISSNVFLVKNMSLSAADGFSLQFWWVLSRSTSQWYFWWFPLMDACALLLVTFNWYLCFWHPTFWSPSMMVTSHSMQDSCSRSMVKIKVGGERQHGTSEKLKACSVISIAITKGQGN